MKSCGCQNTHPIYYASPTTKASGAYHQEGSLEALKKGKKGGDNKQASKVNLTNKQSRITYISTGNNAQKLMSNMSRHKVSGEGLQFTSK